MSKVSISNVVVLNNPAAFTEPFKFEVTFECYEPIKDDLEFKLIYVGSAESDAFDQVLDSVLVGPLLPEGRHMFVFEADAPVPSKIPSNEAVGVTVVLLTCSYKNQEFLKIGYFILTEYTDPELKENPPVEPRFELLRRLIDVQNPRVTKVPIKWDDTVGAGMAGDLETSLSDLDASSSAITSQENNTDGAAAIVVNENGDGGEAAPQRAEFCGITNGDGGHVTDKIDAQ